jgi:hypothetical protein
MHSDPPPPFPNSGQATSHSFVGPETHSNEQPLTRMSWRFLCRVVCCGHSLGGALSTLAAYWCKTVAFKVWWLLCMGVWEYLV